MFRKAAEQGNADAKNNLGYAYYWGEGVAKSHNEAVEWWIKAGEQGHDEAQDNLRGKTNAAQDYQIGNGVAKSHKKAVEWWRKAAEQGDSKAQTNLGEAYFNGEGVAKNLKHAVEWFKKAAEQGHAAAKQQLANLESSVPAQQGQKRPLEGGGSAEVLYLICVFPFASNLTSCVCL